jgi:hypothetical protein
MSLPKIIFVVCTENLVRFDLIRESLNVDHDGRANILCLNLGASFFKPKSWLETENAALRQQLIVLQRGAPSGPVHKSPSVPRKKCRYGMLPWKRRSSMMAQQSMHIERPNSATCAGWQMTRHSVASRSMLRGSSAFCRVSSSMSLCSDPFYNENPLGKGEFGRASVGRVPYLAQ